MATLQTFTGRSRSTDSLYFHQSSGPMPPESYVTLEAYLAIDAEADIKHEYWDGRVIAMASAEPEHNQLTGNLATEFNVRLRSRGCRVAVADQRVRVNEMLIVSPRSLTRWRKLKDCSIAARPRRMAPSLER